jgi:hypothetical protein
MVALVGDISMLRPLPHKLGAGRETRNSSVARPARQGIFHLLTLLFEARAGPGAGDTCYCSDEKIIRMRKSMQVFTSSGAGTWGPPLRLGSNPEIVILEFQ